MTSLKVLVSSWYALPHSYGIVAAFLLIHLQLNYGPDGKIRKNAIDIYVEDAPFFNPEWNGKRRWVYSEEYNTILKNLKTYNGETIDVIYRQSYPYNINVAAENRDVPKCVFYTSEFAKLTDNHFLLEKPVGLDSGKYNDYIKLFIDSFKNIYFTTPSEWSAKGMAEYASGTRNRIITHGVDTSIFKRHATDAARARIRRNYKIAETDVLMLNIGAMTSNKGILLILECLNVLVHRQSKPEFKLMLKGSGDLYQCTAFLNMYFAEFKKTGVMTECEIDNLLANHIIFIDATLSFEGINDLYQASDVYISPFLAEGFNLTVLESLAAGLPVLVPTTGGAKEYIDAIYKNGGSEYITYVESVVGADKDGLCHNIITLEDLLSAVNSINFTIRKGRKNYEQMVDYINSKLSWDCASTLLFDYFRDIVDVEYS